MANLFDHVRLLHEQELYHDLKTMCSMVLSLSEQNADVFSMTQKYQMMVFYGDSLYQTEEFKKAEDIYRKALSLKKAINKTKGKSSHLDLVSDVDVKYKIHQCHYSLGQLQEALNVLESVTTKQRSAKINMSLARLYHRTGMDRSAITCYKEVLRECPLALEAITGLICLGVKGPEVVALVMPGIGHGVQTEWLSLWIKGHSFLAAQDFPLAITSFKSLDAKPYMKDNVNLLCSLGEAHFKQGDYPNALLVFQRAHTLDPYNLRNMDIYAYMLAREKRVKELESLSNKMMSVTELAPEPWIVVGYFCMVTKKATRAVYFAQRAYAKDSRNIEALLLKGSALVELKKIPEALLHFREALRLAPHRYEAHAGLIDCYTSSRRTLKEAITVASKAIRTLARSARSLTLYASVLARVPTMEARAKPYLEKAMKLDANYLEPVYIMAEILGKEHNFWEGINLLRGKLYHHSTCRLHQMLGDFLTWTNEHQEALDHYSIALGIDPTNTQAREGMERVEKQSESGPEPGIDMELVDGSENEAEPDFEESDVDSSALSETDFM
ncbi:anaphase-promoting complex subunit 7-like [Liolophura sinensis]|uniref:anaphase-promoting complex subunit 7-like n=1 Tax=Liolophura sinensis TaxID=3198878 RepID=UPI0031584787